MPYLNTDIPELRGYDTGTVLQNLEELEMRQNLISESRIAQLDELISAILSDGEEEDTLISILLSLRDSGSVYPEREENTEIPAVSRVSDVNRAAVWELTRNISLLERLYIYRGILKKRGIYHAEPSGSSFGNVSSLNPNARSRVAYVSSTPADRAYLKFSDMIDGCRALELFSFEETCKEVYNGLCEYCILPVEHSENGRLHSFLRLILKYGLKIVAVTDIGGNIANAELTRDASSTRESTRFALLCRGISVLDGDVDRATATDKIGSSVYLRSATVLELIHPSDPSSPYSFAELLLAAQFSGLRLISVNSITAETGISDSLDVTYLSVSRSFREPTSPSDLSVAFDVRGGDTMLFLHYLSLESSDDNIIGIYRAV